MNESTLVPREEMSDLDWMARNVHVWPAGEHQPWCYVYWKGGRRAISGNCITVIQPCVRIEKSDWLARRAELQNKPSWTDHPDAKCFFQHENGVWSKNIESHDMGVDEIGWRNKYQSLRADYGWLDVGKGEVLGDWRDTLEKRPEQTIADICEGVTSENRREEIFEPFVSVEDAATAKQSAPKGSGNPILGMVLTDLTNRALEGKEKYGEPLLAHNGRNPLWDAYQEALDLAMYLRQAIEEQKQ